MPTLERATADARSYARAVMMATFTTGMVTGATTLQRFVPEAERDALYQAWMKNWAKGLLKVFGVDARYANPAPVITPRARLVVANHRSPLDITLMLATFGGSVLSRADLKNWPVLGHAAKSADTIFVDREDARSGMMAIREIRRRLERGRTVIAFPEGGTFAGDQVQPFREGVFAAMRGLQVEVIPFGLAYDPGVEFFNETFMQHLKRVAARPITRVGVCFGEPRIASQSRRELSAALQTEVQALTDRARSML
jgi:1-acyl-sn-glycerol-3-phosphate acyltransferase